MRSDLLTAAVLQSSLLGRTKLLLIAIGARCEGEEYVAVGIRALAADVGLTVRSVQRHVRKAVAAGALSVRPRPGRSSTYALTLDLDELLRASTRAWMASPHPVGEA